MTEFEKGPDHVGTGYKEKSTMTLNDVREDIISVVYDKDKGKMSTPVTPSLFIS